MATTLLLSQHLPLQFLPTLSPAPPKRQQTSSLHQPTRRLLQIHATQQTTDKKTQTEKETSSSAEEITKKYGLEFGLWNIFRSREEEAGPDGTMKKKSKTDQAKELLAKYGGAYLATSITLSLISFTLCYLLVSAGIDVQALLSKVGIVVDENAEKLGAFALAYAAHKAASPIRFPPTVALTPIVAGWIGKKKMAGNDEK